MNAELFIDLHIHKFFQLKLHWSQFHMLYAYKQLESELPGEIYTKIETKNLTLLEYDTLIQKP